MRAEKKWDPKEKSLCWHFQKLALYRPYPWRMEEWQCKEPVTLENCRPGSSPSVTAKHLKGFSGSRRESLLSLQAQLSGLGWEKVSLLQEHTPDPWIWDFSGNGCAVLRRGSRVNRFTTKSTETRNPEVRFQCGVVVFLHQIKSEFGYSRIPVFGHTLTSYAPLYPQVHMFCTHT